MCFISPSVINSISQRTCHKLPAPDAVRGVGNSASSKPMTIFNSFFRRPKASPPPASQPISALDNSDEAPQVTVLKTLVIVYDPVVDPKTGAKLSEFMHWNRVEDLAKGFITDILQTSGGLAAYQ